MTLSTYTVISGVVDAHLDRWLDEAQTCAKFISIHPHVSACALARAQEAKQAYYATAKLRQKLIANNLI